MHRFGGMGLAASLLAAWGPKTLEARMRDADQKGDGKLGLDDVTAGAMAGGSRALVFAR